MICICGYQNEPEDFYCAQCGRKLSEKKGKGWIIAVVVVGGLQEINCRRALAFLPFLLVGRQLPGVVGG